MRHLFSRLRAWLADRREALRRWAIQKLGGYVERTVYQAPPLLGERNRRIQLFLSASCGVSDADIMDENKGNSIETTLVGKAALDITMQLLEAKAFEVDTRRDARDGTVTVRVSLRVVMPNRL